MVCFKTDEDDPGNIVVEVLCAWWTDAGGGFIAYAGAGTTVTAQSGPGRVTVTVRHSGKQFEAGVVGTVMGQITVSNVHYTVADTQRPLDELTEVLWTCHYDGTISPGESCETDAGCTSSSGGNCGPPDITWLPLDGTTLDYDQDKTYYLDEQAHETTVLFRFDAGGNTPAAGRGTWSSRELLQFGVCAIPTVSAWGMVVIAVLVLSAGTILIRRRRALAA